MTAIVFTVALPLTAGLPTEVAVTVAVLTLPFVALAGTLTLTQTFVVPPGDRVAVVVSGVVQLASKKLTAYVPPEELKL